MKINLGLGSILFLVFLVLQLCGVIAWSWWWVTAPLWGPFAIIVLFAGFAVFVAAAAKAFK